MTFKSKIVAKVRSMAKKTYQQAAPIVKKEIQKTVEKGKDNVLCSILDGVEIIAMGALMLSVVIRPSDILGAVSSEDSRNIYNSYYEVHVTNNYYLKGEN